MKYKALLSLLLVFLLVLSGQAAAYTVDMEVNVNGRDISGQPFAQDGVTYVHIVPFLEALGGWSTAWDQESRTASAETGDFTLAAPIQSRQALVDGAAYDMNAPVLGQDGRTYVPLRALANLLGADVTYVNPQTPVTVTSRAPYACTEEDLYWLSRVISAESRGECLLGQMAVGNVVLNRVASDGYPDTIQAVIFDNAGAVQFTPTENGTIYDDPTGQSVLAARLVLNGASVVGDCKFFFSPALSPGTWIRQNCQYYTTIGCHMFYR